MVVHVPVVVLHTLANRRLPATVKAVSSVQQGLYRVLEHGEFLAEGVEGGDDLSRLGRFSKDVPLELVELGLELIDDREVVIYDLIHQGVEHVSRSVHEQMGLVFASLANGLEPEVAATRRQTVGV